MAERLQQQLTILEEYHCNGGPNRTCLCLCGYCGKECIRILSMVKNNTVKSCGCICKKRCRNPSEWLTGNTNRRKLLTIEEIPEKFRDHIQLNTGSQAIGKRHREMFSSVKCLYCNNWKSERNQRIREQLRKRGYMWKCGKCNK